MCLLVFAVGGCSPASTAGASSADAAAPDAPTSCVHPAWDIAPKTCAPVERFDGACTSADLDAFAAACADDPSARACGAFLGATPSCARCILGDALPGVLRKDSFGVPEISSGACAEVVTGEIATVDAGADANVGGCAESLENAAAFVAATCVACAKDDEGCARAAAALEQERDPSLAACLDAGASACLFGSAHDRARAIAAAVCGIPAP